MIPIIICSDYLSTNPLLVFETLVCMRMLFAIKKDLHTTGNITECGRTLTLHTLYTLLRKGYIDIQYKYEYIFKLLRSTAKM